MRSKIRRKGQVNIHFIVSTTLFIVLVIYLINIILNFYPSYTSNYETDVLYSKAYSVSELLLKNKGYPDNWNSDDFERVGLASEPYSLNLSKIDELEEICNTTNLTKKNRFLDSFGLQNNNLMVDIIYVNGTQVLDCSMGPKPLERKAKVERLAELNGNIVRVAIHVS